MNTVQQFMSSDVDSKWLGASVMKSYGMSEDAIKSYESREEKPVVKRSRRKRGVTKVKRMFTIDMDVNAVLNQVRNQSRAVNEALRVKFNILPKSPKK